MAKIDPNPTAPPEWDPNSTRYWDERDLEGEARRTFEICHSCRMCVNYCGSFPDMFARVDRDIEKRNADGAELLDNKDMQSVSDLCWQCKLCYIKCPYTADEGHNWLVDVPRLLTRIKAQGAKRNGITIQDRVLGEPQLLGKMTAGPLAPVANLVNANRLVRKVAEKAAGISSEFLLPPFGRVSFESWLKKHQPQSETGRVGTVAIFATCLGDYNFPNVAVNAVTVLEKNGFAVTRPAQTCCGMPNVDGGDIAAAQAKARANVDSLLAEVEAGRKIVCVQPTCAYMIRKEWPELLGTEDAKIVAKNTVDVMEFLDQLRKEKTLNREFKGGHGKVAYHAACHLRAQKIGFPGMRVLSLLPETEVETIERCSAVDGTWGMKAQYYEMGRKYAQKLVQGVRESEPKLVVTDCSLSARRIEQETGMRPLHPIEALAQAYGTYVDVG